MNQQAILINQFLNDVFPKGGKARSVKTSSGSFPDLMKSAACVSGQARVAGAVSGESSLDGLRASLLCGREQTGSLRGQRWIQQLRKLVLAQGIHPDQVSVSDQNLEDMKQILLNIGFDANDVAGLMAELNSETDSNQLSLTQLFARMEQLPEPVTASPGNRLEISALPFIESILSGLGLDSDDIDDVLSDATNETDGIDVKGLADNLKAKIRQLPDQGRDLADETTQDSVCALMTRIGLADTAAASSAICLEKFAELLSAKARSSTPDPASLLSQNGLSQVRLFLDHLEVSPADSEQLPMYGSAGVRSGSNPEVARFLLFNGSSWQRHSANIQSLEILEQFLNDAGYDPVRVSEVIDKLTSMSGNSTISLSRVLAQLRSHSPNEPAAAGGDNSDRFASALKATSPEYRHESVSLPQLAADDPSAELRNGLVRYAINDAASEPVHESFRDSGRVAVRSSAGRLSGAAEVKAGREVSHFTEQEADIARQADTALMKASQDLSQALVSGRSLSGGNSAHASALRSTSWNPTGYEATQFPESRWNSGIVAVRPSAGHLSGAAEVETGREVSHFTEQGADIARQADTALMKASQDLSRALVSGRSLSGGNSARASALHSTSWKQTAYEQAQPGKGHVKARTGENGFGPDRADMDPVRQLVANSTESHGGKSETEAKADPQDGFAMQSFARQRVISAEASEASAQKPSDSPVPAYVLNQVNKRTMILQQSGKTQMEFRLNPAYLGRLNLKVHQTEDGIRVTIVTEKSAARDLLRAHSEELKAAFTDQNLQLDRIEVTVSHDFNQTLADTGHNSERHFSGRQVHHEEASDMPAPEEAPAENPENFGSQTGVIHLVA